MDTTDSVAEGSSDQPSPRQRIEAEAAEIVTQRGGSFVKAKMGAFAQKNPLIAAERTAARARAKLVGRFLPGVSGLFTDQNLERAAQVIVEQLDAEMPVVVAGEQTVTEGKIVNTGQSIEFVPDNKARMDAAKFVTAMVEGLPVARQINIQADFKSLDDERKALLLGSSAVQEALEDLKRDFEPDTAHDAETRENNP